MGLPHWRKRVHEADEVLKARKSILPLKLFHVLLHAVLAAPSPVGLLELVQAVARLHSDRLRRDRRGQPGKRGWAEAGQPEGKSPHQSVRCRVEAGRA